MKINFVLKFSSLCMALFLMTFSSCKEEYLADAEKREGKINVNNGRLTFDSDATFRSTIQSLIKQQDKLDEWEKQWPSFTSMRRAYNQISDEKKIQLITSGDLSGYESILAITGEGDEKEMDIIISDPILATLVSNDGYLYIGDKAYKFMSDKFFIIQDYDDSKLSKINKNTKADKLAGIEMGKVNHQSLNLANARTAASITCIQNYEMRGGIGGIKKRLTGDIDYSDYGTAAGSFYVGVTFYTKHQQRILGIWTEVNTEYVYLEGTYYPNGLAPVSFNLTGNNDGKIQYTIPSNCNSVPGGFACTGEIRSANSYHEGKCNDGRVRFCNLAL